LSLLGEICLKLRATAAVTAVVPAAQIYQEQRPQGQAWPSITITSPDTEHGQDLSGSAGYGDFAVDVNIWARLIDDRDAAGEAVRLALHGFSGTLTTLYVQGILLESDTTFFEPDRVAAQNGFFHRYFRFVVMRGESVPS
jgi:hypothetical protein